ncbi:MAG: VWA domain-containing protein [Planctomycetota bacterium]
MIRAAAALLLISLPAAVGAELSQPEWQRVRREASELGGRAGELERKSALVDTLASEDSARTAAALLEFAAGSHERRTRTAERLDKAERDLAKSTKRLRKKHGRKASRAIYENDARWRALRDSVKKLGSENEAEEIVMRMARNAIGRFRTPAAIAVLVDTSDRTNVRARASAEVRDGILEALSGRPADEVVDHVLALGTASSSPDARVRVLRWIGLRKVQRGFDACVAALPAKQTSVARAAVQALDALDDRRAVPILIRTRAGTDGLLAEEIELVLYRFTGKQFFGAGAGVMWAGWWRSEGEAWKKAAPADRFPVAEAKKKGRAASFYGIETRSNRIVFVLDRSGSMTKEVPQRGPVSGGRPDDRVPGRTRIEVARNQLARTIRQLSPGVKFAVVFFSEEVKSWTSPPAMKPANAKNKHEAIEWFELLPAVGSTMTFDALREALRYAKVDGGKSATDPKGADTIFLLSDGAPSTKGGKDLLTGEALEKEIVAFLEANNAFGCVVHTIGVGPVHGRALLERLASATGGTYKAVGTR